MDRNPFNIITGIIFLSFLGILQTGCEKDEASQNVPVITTHEITDIKIKSAVGGGTITSDQGAEVTFRGICWSTNQTPTIADNKTIDGTGVGNFSSSITGLSANTTYYVRAYATNINGTGYGSTMSFTTLATQFTDTRDGNVYQIVTIGNQIWMAENLKYLPSVVRPSTSSATVPYYYVLGYNIGTNVNAAKATADYSTYGVLYNWPAAIIACPTGWHLPSDVEWTQLTDYLGGSGMAGGKLKETGTTHWTNPNTGATNESGFTALPGGYRSSLHNVFLDPGRVGYWWTSTTFDATQAQFRRLQNHNSNVDRDNYSKDGGFSIRCIMD